MTLDLFHSLIPVLVPLLIALAKWGVPRVPKVWLPILAPVLGAGVDVLAYVVGLQDAANPVLGAVLGAVGVALREILDQLKQAMLGSPSPDAGRKWMWLLVLGTALGLAPVPATADEAAILARLDGLEARINARLSALESRLDARAAQPFAAPVAPDLNAQISSHFAAVANVKLMQSMIKTLDPPRGFMEQAVGGDSTIPALAVIAVILKAIGGTFALGF